LRQFDICDLKGSGGQLVVVLQHRILDGLSTVIVAPISSEQTIIAKVRRPIEIEGETYVLQLDRIAAVPRSALGSFVGNLSADGDAIKDGLDLLFFGI
jgi:toxin CcdB